MLTAEQREEIRALIEQEIAKLEESVERLRERLEVVAPDVAIGRLSRLDSMVNQGTAEMALGDAQKKLNRLMDKRARVDDPNFGRCARCEEWISIERLRAAPDRGVCVKCMQTK